jgi:hypothetical protein
VQASENATAWTVDNLLKPGEPVRLPIHAVLPRYPKPTLDSCPHCTARSPCPGLLRTEHPHRLRCAADVTRSQTGARCSAGDEVHFFHVVSPPHAEVIGGFGGVGGVDELIAAEPDPAADHAHVSACRCARCFAGCVLHNTLFCFTVRHALKPRSCPSPADDVRLGCRPSAPGSSSPRSLCRA